MKRFLVIIFISFVYVSLSTQGGNSFGQDEKGAFTIGVLNGGGGLLGVDLEYLITESIGIQAGVGFVSFGGGLNYHFNSGGVRSSFINLGYWHQGIGDSYTQSLLGPSYVFRLKRILQAQLGIGVVLEQTSNFQGVEVPVVLMYSLGIYLPFK